jgi:predicted secreted protein
VGWSGDQIGMGQVFLAAVVVPLMAGDAGQVVARVEMNGMTIPAASRSSMGRWRKAAAENEQQKACQEQGQVNPVCFRQESGRMLGISIRY